MAKTAYKNVDGYIAQLPATVQPAARRVRELIRKALPDAEEVISYQIAAYRAHGRIALFFAGWKEHYAIYPISAALRATLADELAGYELSKGTIRFPLDEPVPARLITRIAKLLAAEAEQRTLASAKKKKAKAPSKKKATKRTAAKKRTAKAAR